MTTPSATAVASTAPRKWRRVHGLQPPLHPQQAVAWIFILFFTLFNFGVLLPTMHSAVNAYLVSIESTTFTS